LDLPGPNRVVLLLKAFPARNAVRPGYRVETGGGGLSPIQWVGGRISVPPSWLDRRGALAAGIISTSRGAADPFPATWEYLRAYRG
jgi:hypothetical protein